MQELCRVDKSTVLAVKEHIHDKIARSLKTLCKSRHLNAAGEKRTDLKIIVENIFILQQKENYFLIINIYHLVYDYSCPFMDHLY